MGRMRRGDTLGLRHLLGLGIVGLAVVALVVCAALVRLTTSHGCCRAVLQSAMVSS
jgi:hypothetical protein